MQTDSGEAPSNHSSGYAILVNEDTGEGYKPELDEDGE